MVSIGADDCLLFGIALVSSVSKYKIMTSALSFFSLLRRGFPCLLRMGNFYVTVFVAINRGETWASPPPFEKCFALTCISNNYSLLAFFKLFKKNLNNCPVVAFQITLLFSIKYSRFLSHAARVSQPLRLKTGINRFGLFTLNDIGLLISFLSLIAWN